MSPSTRSIARTLEVNVPVHVAYDQWTQFEDFPRFLEGVEDVRQLDDRTLAWVASVAGHRKAWKAQIVEQEPDRLIAWRGMEGAVEGGSVSFFPTRPGWCRVALTVTYDVEGPLEKAGDALGLLAARVDGDLERFKRFVEARQVATGAWRGAIHHGVVRPGAPEVGGPGS